MSRHRTAGVGLFPMTALIATFATLVLAGSVLLSLYGVRTPSGRSQLSEAARPQVPGPRSPQSLYLSSCAACHGMQGQGVPRQGVALTRSALVASSDTESLVKFLGTGRAADDPANGSGLPMPPRGGNPSLSDAELRLIAGYVQFLSTDQPTDATHARR